MDKNGNLYGTTQSGYSYGSVFELSPGPDGVWKEKTLHVFNGREGEEPEGGLIFDEAGNLYGTTEFGASQNCSSGCGAVFELTPEKDGSWTETVLHSFTGSDGGHPQGNLIFDRAGNLYGAGASEGSGNHGVVFELTPAAEGKWTCTVLHNFSGGTDGADPIGSLIFDADGNLYGTTTLGGTNDPYVGGNGTVFELTPTGGAWTETVLYNFSRSGDGIYPYSGLIFDGFGNLYGAASEGARQGCEVYSKLVGCGTAFELMPTKDGGWAEDILGDFHTSATGGYFPTGSLTFDGSGNFYGATQYGGASASAFGGGEIFKFSPLEGGGWERTLLHDFGHNLDGYAPNGNLIVDAAGNLYGTTQFGGGDHNSGTVFEIIP